MTGNRSSIEWKEQCFSPLYNYIMTAIGVTFNNILDGLSNTRFNSWWYAMAIILQTDQDTSVLQWIGQTINQEELASLGTRMSGTYVITDYHSSVAIVDWRGASTEWNTLVNCFHKALGRHSWCCVNRSITKFIFPCKQDGTVITVT